VPTLPSTPSSGALDAVAALDSKKLGALTADELLKLAAAHEAIEGSAAYDASTAKGESSARS